MKRVPVAVHQSQSCCDSAKLLAMMKSALISVVEEDAPRWKIASRPRALGGEEVFERFGCDEGRELALAEIAPFLVAAEPVADDDVGQASLFQRRDQVRADEAGAAGDEDHGRGYRRNPISCHLLSS